MASIYLITEDLIVARGITSSNPQYGIGGIEQIVIPGNSPDNTLKIDLTEKHQVI